jgi:hypothetical protein
MPIERLPSSLVVTCKSLRPLANDNLVVLSSFWGFKVLTRSDLARGLDTMRPRGGIPLSRVGQGETV